MSEIENINLPEDLKKLDPCYPLQSDHLNGNKQFSVRLLMPAAWSG